MTKHFFAVTAARLCLAAAGGCAYSFFAVLNVSGEGDPMLFFGTFDFLLLAVGASAWAHCEWKELSFWARIRRG